MSAAGLRDPLRTHRRWSLWEVLEFNASNFYHLSTALSAACGLLSGRISGGLQDQETFVAIETRALLHQILKEQLENLGVLNAKVTMFAATEIMKWLAGERHMTYGHLEEELNGLSITLRRELTMTRLYAIESSRHIYYAPVEPLFGVEFSNGFSSAAFELDEAAKCLALDRSTASVFHLMRMMELGIRAVAQCLGVPDPVKPAERNWGKMLKAIRAGIEGKWPTVADRASGDGAVFEALYASLDAVKNPWRNATMHVENKYTVDEAEHIFVAVKGFMRTLASRCDERGEPKA